MSVDWHGWSRSSKAYHGESLHVGPLPGRKQIAVYSMDYRSGAVMHVHAYCRSVEEGERLLAVLDRLLGEPDRTIYADTVAGTRVDL